MNILASFDALQPKAKKHLLDDFCRKNLYWFAQRAFSIVYPGETFLPNWHIEAMCFELEELIRGRNHRLIVNLPPRHLKSYCAVIALPAFLLGLNPSARIIVATYSQDLGAEHGERLRRLMNSDWYQQLFPRTRIRTQNHDELRTTQGGGRRNVSPKSATTGFGADVIVIDDLINGAEINSETIRSQATNFYRDALHSRLNRQETGRIVSIQQRLHDDDFPAFLLEQGGWRHINLRATALADETFLLYAGRRHKRKAGGLLFPELQSEEVLQQIRRDIGNPAFSAQYQQEPVTPGGALLRLDKLRFYEEGLDYKDFHGILQSWDTAYSTEPGADFSVCTTWGYKDERWHLIDVWRQRVAFPELITAIKSQKQRWGAVQVVIEAIGSGLSVMQHFRNEDPKFRSWMKGVKPKDGKEQRVAAQTANLESGKFLFPAHDLPWKEALFRELRAFPNGKYDDQVDSLTQAVKFITTKHLVNDARPDPVRSKPVRAKGSRLLLRERREAEK